MTVSIPTTFGDEHKYVRAGGNINGDIRISGGFELIDRPVGARGGHRCIELGAGAEIQTDDIHVKVPDDTTVRIDGSVDMAGLYRASQQVHNARTHLDGLPAQFGESIVVEVQAQPTSFSPDGLAKTRITGRSVMVGGGSTISYDWEQTNTATTTMDSTLFAPAGTTIADYISTGNTLKINSIDVTQTNGTAYPHNGYVTNSSFDGTTNTYSFDVSAGNLTTTEGGMEWIAMGNDGAFAMDPRTRRCLKVAEGPEDRARRLLCRMVGMTAFKNYIRNGFLNYRGKSGKVYQLFPGHEMTKVWLNGEPVETLCVIFQDNKLPPTDAVVMRLLMLENDEAGFRKMANVFGFTPPKHHPRSEEIVTGRILRLAEDKKAGRIEIADGCVLTKRGKLSFATTNDISIAVA